MNITHHVRRAVVVVGTSAVVSLAAAGAAEASAGDDLLPGPSVAHTDQASAAATVGTSDLAPCL